MLKNKAAVIYKMPSHKDLKLKEISLVSCR